jgi:nucleotide-binding universal stress UspA family protein
MADVFCRLLLATEHSDFDVGAEALAFALARRCGLPLAGVMPILSNPEYEALAPQLAARTDEQAGDAMQALAADAARAEVALTMRARHGPEPYLEIVDEAVQQSADLIVIRRRGKRGFLGQVRVGEMVRKVVAHSPCSVLIAPREARMWTQCVLTPVDPQAPALRVVALAAAVARDCAVPLSIIAVASGDEPEARHAAEATLQQAVRAAGGATGLRVDTQLRIGRTHEQILAAAATAGASLIVMGRDGETRPGRAWFGGATQKVIGLAQLPVLVAVFPNLTEPAAP